MEVDAFRTLLSPEKGLSAVVQGMIERSIQGEIVGLGADD